MDVQPYNSMVPATIQSPDGEQRGMTRADAQRTMQEPIDPNDWISLLNMSSACHILGHDARAISLAERALEASPNMHAASYINLAVILGSMGQLRQAHLAAEKAYRADPNNRTAATIHAESLLRGGFWRKGWSLFHNYYDANRVSLFRHVIHEWEGQSLLEKRLLVIEGGGFGDNFFFLRWLPILKALGAHITYLCPESMCELMSMQPYIDRVIPTSQGEAQAELRPAEFDYFVPLLALGGKLHATSGDPWRGTYIRAPRQESKRMRIGFCWQAGEASLPRPFRSLSAAQTHRITAAASKSGAEVMSLVPHDWEKNLGWEETARLIGTCQRIITVDTAIAHLAGAMEVPVRVLLPGFSAWYYGMVSCSTPLYPSMRLYRNHVRGLDIAVSACIRDLEVGI